MNRTSVIGFVAGIALFSAANVALALPGFMVRVQNASATPAVPGVGPNVDNINEGELLLAGGGVDEATANPLVINFPDNGFPVGTNEDDFAVQATGFVDIIGGTSASGVVLYVNSDDGFRLRVNGVVVSEFVGPTGSSNTATGPLTLNDNDFIQLTMFERDGGEFLRFRLNNDSGAFIGDTASGILINMTAAIPEPATLSLLALGGLAILGRRRNRVA